MINKEIDKIKINKDKERNIDSMVSSPLLFES